MNTLPGHPKSCSLGTSEARVVEDVDVGLLLVLFAPQSNALLGIAKLREREREGKKREKERREKRERRRQSV